MAREVNTRQERISNFILLRVPGRGVGLALAWVPADFFCNSYIALEYYARLISIFQVGLSPF